MQTWLLCAMLFAPQAPAPAPPPPSPATAAPANPVFEVGASHHHVWDEDASLGPWRVVHGSLAWQPPLRVRPRFELERQSRPDGGHYRGTLGAYVDWTPSLYSYQAFTLAPAAGAATRFYPTRRGDVRVFWKMPRYPSLTLAGGYTGLTFGAPQRSDIVNIGALVYRPGVITQGTLYLNRNSPGALHSAAGNLAVQFGAEGKAWYGVNAGGGRELYRLGTLASGATADFTTATVGGFVRRWLTPSAGIHATAEYQRIIGSYSRAAVAANLFVGF
jgi:YaiO family outer membrane protein